MESVQIIPNHKKIAICLSGQVRTWKKCITSWANIYSQIPNCQVDYFIHMWDKNSNPMFAPNPNQYTKVQDDELSTIIEILKPKKVIVDSPKSFEKHPVKSVHLSQFYSSMRAGRLKKEYEIENDMLYDVSIKSRFDLIFYQPVLSQFSILDPKTIYGTHYGFDHKNRMFCLADMFYYSDSLTFDILSNFYYGLKDIPPQYTHPDKFIPPEYMWHHYFKSNNIDIRVNYWDFKIMRDSAEHVSSKTSQYETF